MNTPEHRAPLRSWMLVVVAASVTLFSCAHAAEVGTKQDPNVEVLKQRLEEAERSNARTAVRVEELEESLFLLHDRLEASQLAMQRYASRQTQEAPGRVPESFYRGSAIHGNNRTVKRIRLTNPQHQDHGGWDDVQHGNETDPDLPAGDVEDVTPETVITQESFDEFSIPRRHADTSVKSKGARKAQDRVTDERLAVSGTSNTKVAPRPQGAENVAAAEANPGSLGAYKSALRAYRAGLYDEARAGFGTFMSAGPRRDYVDNALYWLGECHFGLGEFATSVAFFRRVITEEPNGNKVPDAMLKMALATERLGNRDEAVEILTELKNLYPDTHAARIGATRLRDVHGVGK
jgi:tol-pal system protein YbgF